MTFCRYNYTTKNRNSIQYINRIKSKQKTYKYMRNKVHKTKPLYKKITQINCKYKNTNDYPVETNYKGTLCGASCGSKRVLTQ